jgi:hypothetical protein
VGRSSLSQAEIDGFVVEDALVDVSFLSLGAAHGDRPAPAMAAVLLGILHMARGDEPQGMGWIGRTGRLAEG